MREAMKKQPKADMKRATALQQEEVLRCFEAGGVKLTEERRGNRTER